jgi:hypothetical protein
MAITVQRTEARWVTTKASMAAAKLQKKISPEKPSRQFGFEPPGRDAVGMARWLAKNPAAAADFVEAARNFIGRFVSNIWPAIRAVVRTEVREDVNGCGIIGFTGCNHSGAAAIK